MRAESKHESPSSEGSPPPKQDPLERRRLQNRLSQRNHRRKIRDRIAKLQERVIANELRAAASLNGWDQTYSQSLISTRHSHQEPELFFGSRDSPQSTEPCTPFFSPYMFSNPTYSADINLSQSPELCADPFRHFESECLGSTAQNMSGCEIGFLGNEQDIENFHDPWGNLNTRSSIMADSRSGSTINQPNIYVATESSLPHILSALKTSSSLSKVIVLVPPESFPSLQNSTLGMATNGSRISSTGSMNSYNCDGGIDCLQPTPPTAINLSCQCHQPQQNSYSFLASQMPSRLWTNAAPYMPVCPLRKSQSPPGDSFSALHI